MTDKLQCTKCNTISDIYYTLCCRYYIIDNI